MHKETANGFSIHQLSKTKSGNLALDQLTLFIPFNKKTAIIGETGSGKSTLLKLMAGLEQQDAGHINYGHERIKGAEEQLIPGHPHIGYLSQYAELRNNYKINEVLDYDNRLSLSERELVYSICDIGHLMHRWSDELSGGEKQRVAMAQMLAKKPNVILLDEPFSHLDNSHKKNIKQILDRIVNEMQVKCVMVTHDSRDVFGWADEIHVLRKGRWVQSGSPEQLFHQPVDVYVAGLLGEFQLMPTEFSYFAGLPAIPDNEYAPIMIRPGYFSPNFPNGIKVSVLECVFKGDFYYLKVAADKFVFVICISSLHGIDFEDLVIGYNQKKVHLISSAT